MFYASIISVCCAYLFFKLCICFVFVQCLIGLLLCPLFINNIRSFIDLFTSDRLTHCWCVCFFFFFFFFFLVCECVEH